MVKIKIEDNKLFINETLITPEMSKSDFKKLLSETTTEGNTFIKWDKIGINIELENSVWDYIEVYYDYNRPGGYDIEPSENFSGEFLINDEEAFQYKKSHKNKLVRLRFSDSRNSFIFGDISCTYDEAEFSVNKVIRIQKFNGGIFENPAFENYEKLKKKKELSKYEELWTKWIEVILKHVPKDNSYFNLKEGITKDEIKENKKLAKKVSITDELIDFYKVFNADYNGVAYVFSFEIQGIGYDLIPFENIPRHWEEMQDLNDEDNQSNIDHSKISEKVQINDYTNPQWIPFAEDREGNYLLYDNDPSPSGKKGQIIELENETWLRKVVADSLEELIEKEIENWKKGKTELLDFILDVIATT